ncbi:rod shape-determining protein MreC [Tyzzerella sp. OttesenSCG-928-J15]|nr:rod shape-determining protein MreC [Tyzzerella sp. OttesenSCG-928-J15]
MEFFKEHKKATFLMVALACIVVGILTLNFKKPTFFENLIGFIVAPTQQATSGISGWFSEKIDFISNLNEIENMNAQLIKENERLKYEASRVEQLAIENERLALQIGLKPRYPGLPLLGAYITATDSNSWSNMFTIDKGSNDGVSENMMVLANGGLVGRVYKAKKTSALIVPIIDDTSSIGAQTKRTGDLGFVKGDLKLAESGYCRMENIDAEADILENDEIVTSSLSAIFHPGITIGYVKEITMDADGLTKQALIQPVVDFKQLDTVLVVTALVEKEEATFDFEDSGDVESEETEGESGEDAATTP